MLSAGQPGRVLLLGGGFIGAHTAAALRRRGHDVDLLTRSPIRPELAPLLSGVRVRLGDVNDVTALVGPLESADHVIYAVGGSSPVESVIDPASDISAVLPPLVRLLELLKHRPEISLSYLSSGGTIYGNSARSPLVEEIEPSPISSYGILKLAAERYLGMYADLYGVKATVLRIANAYGPGQSWAKGQGLVARLLHCAVVGEPVYVFGVGDTVRDYIFVTDIAESVVRVAEQSAAPRVLNVGSGIGYSIIELIKLVQTVTGRRIAVEFQDERAYDVRSCVLDVAKLQDLVPFDPVQITDGLGRTWAAYRRPERSAA